MQSVGPATDTGEDSGSGRQREPRPNAGQPRQGRATALWLVLGGIGGALVALAVVLSLGLFLNWSRRVGGGGAPLRRGGRGGRDPPRLRRRLRVLRGRRRCHVRLRRRPQARPLPGRRLEPGRALPQREPDRRRVPVREGLRRRHRPAERHRCVSDRRRRRRPDRPRGVAERRQRAAAWPRRLPLRARERPVGLRRRRRMDRRVQRHVGGFGRAADPRVRQLPRPGEGRRPLRVRRQPAGAAAAGRRHIRRADPARAGLLHAVRPVQRLEPLGPHRPPHGQRPPLLPRWRGTAVAHRAGRTPAPLHTRGRVAAAGDLGDGHRQLRRHRRRPARGLPDEPGRQQAPDAGGRDRRADLPGHRDRQGRDRDASVHGRRSPALDGVAPRVPGRERRRVRRPVRLQGQRRGAAGLRLEGPERPADRAGGRDVRRRGPRRGHRELRPGTRRGRRRPQPRRHARHRAGEPSREHQPVPQRRLGHRDRTTADGQLGRGAPRAARPEPRRDRLVDPGAVRRPHRPSASSRSAGVTRAASLAGSISAWAGPTRRRSGSSGPTARSVPGRRSARTASSRSPAEGSRRRGRPPSRPRDGRAPHRGRPARLRDARGRARDPGRDLRRPTRTPPRARRRRGLRPHRDLRGPRAQREPRVRDRVRSPLRGGVARRRPIGRAGRLGRQRVLRCRRRRAPADATTPVPGLQPPRPAARPLSNALGDPCGGGHRRRREGRRDRVEDVPGPRHDRDPGVHHGRGPPHDPVRLDRERRPPDDRRRRRPPRPQRGRAAGGVRVRGVPDLERRPSGCCSRSSPGCARTRPCRSCRGTARPCPAT